VKQYTLRRQQLIKRPLPEVFAFFESPENLARITPASMGFEILTPKPIRMQTGSILDYTIRLFGFPVHWTTIIAAYNPPRSFSDVALKSPYSFWHHTHTFEEVEDGTLMTDEVRYALPFGPLGRVAHSLWIEGQLERIFDFRAETIRRLMDPPDRGDATQERRE